MKIVNRPTQNQEMISWQDILKSIPQIVPHIGRIVEGIRYTKIKNPKQSVGLAWAFEKSARTYPNRPALLFFNKTIIKKRDEQGASDDTSFIKSENLTVREVNQYSYSAVNEKANQIAHYLQSRQLAKGDVVALMLENRPELLITILALSKIGAISALLNTEQSGQVLAHSIAVVKPKAIILGSECICQYQSLDFEVEADHYIIPEQGCDKSIITSLSTPTIPTTSTSNPDKSIGSNPADTATLNNALDLLQTCHNQSKENLPSSQQQYLSDPLCYIYTSGTTGLPKAGIMTQGRWMKVYGGLGIATTRLEPTDILYSTLPLYHGTALIVCWASVIAAGAGLAMRRRFSASQFWDDTRLFKATVIAYVGELCRYLLNAPASPSDLINPVNKMVGNGLRPAIWDQFKRRFGIDTVYELYGASDGNIGFANILNLENTVGCTMVRYALVAFDKESEAPIRNQAGFCTTVKRGQTGLLLAEISEQSPLDGYTDSTKTEQTILRDVFKRGDTWFNSGDLLRDIGFRHAQFVDRLGDTYRWKGENVSTTEVENILLQFPGVLASACYGVIIPNTEGRAGMATIQLDPDTPLDLDHLYQFLKAHLPRYAIPRFIRLQQELQTTETFKYKKSQLKEEHYNPKLCDDPLFALLPNNEAYTPLDNTTYRRIHLGGFQF